MNRFIEERIVELAKQDGYDVTVTANAIEGYQVKFVGKMKRKKDVKPFTDVWVRHAKRDWMMKMMERAKQTR